ncbi:transcription factor bHLH123-like [Nicotiana tabacum]|uniref:Transcription factor bHLH123-like n=1 Tax=Nicotiana tabacum TaxID=4097 RepID=A0A1S4BBA6_TOBAC|nr:transcription factor bHLH123-like [Nicotiana tomentosiformis]XP_016486152.1 PREDICTED: transcription factor bHLH123-like [Nicotiana tabacum]
MAEEFQLGNGNWWDNTSISRNSTPTAASTTISNMSSNYSNWQNTETQVDIKPRTFLNSGSVLSESSGGGSGGGGGGGSRGVLSGDNNFQMMGLGLTSQPHEWNQSLLRGEKAESGFSSILQQEDLSSNNTNNYQLEASNSQQDHHWNRQKIYSGNSEDSSSVDDYKQMNFVYNINPSNNYGLSQESAAQDNHVMHSSTTSSWSKFPQLLRTSPPGQQPLPPPPHSQLHFSNNTPFWNASAAAMNDVPSSLFPSNLHPQLPIPTVDEKTKNTGEIRDINRMSKKTSSEISNKRPRDETPSPLPAFKVRKEKMGDRITALQQLVSPFGKTDTASVLSEAIEYIKFLHDQIGALSAPYMKSGSSAMQHQQSNNKSEDAEGRNQDLRSRGLCLVPVSSTFPVTNETTVDFWTPTFGGTFR